MNPLLNLPPTQLIAPRLDRPAVPRRCRRCGGTVDRERSLYPARSRVPIGDRLSPRWDRWRPPIVNVGGIQVGSSGVVVGSSGVVITDAADTPCCCASPHTVSCPCCQGILQPETRSITFTFTSTTGCAVFPTCFGLTSSSDPTIYPYITNLNVFDGTYDVEYTGNLGSWCEYYLYAERTLAARNSACATSAGTVDVHVVVQFNIGVPSSFPCSPPSPRFFVRLSIQAINNPTNGIYFFDGLNNSVTACLDTPTITSFANCGVGNFWSPSGNTAVIA